MARSFRFNIELVRIFYAAEQKNRSFFERTGNKKNRANRLRFLLYNGIHIIIKSTVNFLQADNLPVCKREIFMKVTLEDIRQKPMPKHIAVIMDGNGRWAKSRGLIRTAGHRMGVQALKSLVLALDELDIHYVTVYAFSTENWKRPADEVNTLMDLIVEFLDKELDYMHEKGVRIHPIGDISRLTGKTYDKITAAAELTKQNTNIVLNVALNYGGRQEIVHAAKAICEDVQNGRLTVDDIDEALFGSYLYTAGQPDPDLLIRPSGEMRVSNFLLWQIAYSEFWCTNILWPDFGKEHLWQAIWEYQNRDRRFGGLGK